MPWVLVDLSWLAYRAHYGMVRTLSHDEIPTSVMFGVLEQLRTLCNHPKVRSNKLAIFQDSKHSVRRDVCPTYKPRKAPDTEDERLARDIFREQVKALAKVVFPAIGIPVYRQRGMESDDLIAHAAAFCSFTRQGGIMITADGDLYQCISDYVNWFDPLRDKWHNPFTFEQEYGIKPGQWSMVKRAAGCHSDGVKGVPGIGEKSAIKWLRGELPKDKQKYLDLNADIHNQSGAIQSNHMLVTLPHPLSRLPRLVEPQYSVEGFRSVCEKLGFESYLDGQRWRDWKAIMEGRMGDVVSQQTRRRRGERG